jgi:triacylglycerol esterase/lipase EstA (alpha/beta hydrolase family)
MTGLKMEEQLYGIEMMVSSVTNQKDDEDHFIILVHGFQASRQDFIILKNCLEIRFKTKVFISTCNEGRTDDDIEIQGRRLALELQRYLNDSTPTSNYKLSFIGHSMGGVIIRTALCYLQNVDQHLYSFISLSAPHLGYLYEPSAHIQAGLWFMNTWNKAVSIEQICLRDKEDLKQCFMCKLSRTKTLDKFEKIALVGSTQDKYVPF